jgi:hypothetical protein
LKLRFQFPHSPGHPVFEPLGGRRDRAARLVADRALPQRFRARLRQSAGSAAVQSVGASRLTERRTDRQPNLGNTVFLQPFSGWYWRVVPIEASRARRSLRRRWVGGARRAAGLRTAVRRAVSPDWIGRGTGRRPDPRAGIGNRSRRRPYRAFPGCRKPDRILFAVRDFARRVGLMLVLFSIGVVGINAGFCLPVCARSTGCARRCGDSQRRGGEPRRAVSKRDRTAGRGNECADRQQPAHRRAVADPGRQSRALAENTACLC